MQITTHPIDPELVKNGQVVGEPMIRFSDGAGCGSEHCNCSPGYWISISDGKTLIKAQFDNEIEYKKFLQTGELLA